MASMWIDGNYINYYYDNFKAHSKNAYVIIGLYKMKQTILQDQLAAVRGKINAMRNQTLSSGVDDLMAELLDPDMQQNAVSKMLSSFTEPPILVGKQIGLERSIGSTPSTFYNLPTTLAETKQLADKWPDIAGKLVSEIEQVFSSVFDKIGLRGAVQTNILNKIHNGEPMSFPQYRMVQKLIQKNMSLVYGADEKSVAQIQSAVSQLQIALQGLGSYSTKTNAVQVGRDIKQGVLTLQTMLAEGSLAYLGARAQAKGWISTRKGVMLKSEVTGKVPKEIIYDPAVQQILSESEDFLSSSIPPEVSQKGDITFSVIGDTITATMSVNVKTVSPHGLTGLPSGNYIPGVSFLNTSILSLFDRLELFGRNGAFINAAMNTAAGLPAEHGGAAAEWEMVKEIVAAMSLSMSLTGSNIHQPQSDVVMLVVNQKPYFIDEVIEKVIKVIQSGAIPNAIHLQGWLPRSAYVYLNEYKGNFDNMRDARDRSLELNLNILKTWQRQKIQIKLTQLGNILKT